MTPQTPRGDETPPTQVPHAATVVEAAGTTRLSTSPAGRPSVDLDPVEALRDLLSIWRATGRSCQAVGMPSEAAAYRTCAADVEPLLPVLAAAVELAYEHVCWLPGHQVWVAAGAHPTTAARAFAAAMNGEAS